MRIIDDWLRQHPNLTLTRDQRSDLEELIDEEIGESDDRWDHGEDEDPDTIKGKAFKDGATAMREDIAVNIEDSSHVDNAIGLSAALTVIANCVRLLPIPEVPEEGEGT